MLASFVLKSKGKEQYLPKQTEKVFQQKAMEHKSFIFTGADWWWLHWLKKEWEELKIKKKRRKI